MDFEPTGILLIEDDPRVVQLVREALSCDEAPRFAVTHADRLGAGLKRLEKDSFDVVLLNLSLPDGRGIGTFRAVNARSRRTPIVILTGADDEDCAAEAVEEGAQDYLVKERLTAELLVRSLCYAIERNYLEGELGRVKEVAEAADRARFAFLARMNHELRTPMNGIMGMAEIMLAGPLGEDHRDCVTTINGCAEELLRVVNDILDFSKSERGKLTVETVEFNLKAILEEISGQVSSRARSKGIRLSCRVSEGLTHGLVGDPVRIRQVVTHLVDNAIKFTDAGEVILEARTLDETEGRVTLKVSVRDTGIGIPAEQHDAIFEGFTQVDGSTARRFGGSGLGLALCRRLAGLMSGAIGLESEPGVGSTFSLELNLLRRTSSDAAQRSLSGILDDLRVLVVDRDGASRGVLREQLLSWGCRPTEVDSVGQALEVSRSASATNPIGLVILDAETAGSDVAGAAKTIAGGAQHGQIPLVIVHPMGTAGVDRAAPHGPLSASLVKPVQRSRLLDTLAEVLDRRERGAPARPAETSVGGEIKGLGLRVLVVEDLEINRKVALRLLAQLGCHAESVNDGREALEALARSAYDVVLMDIEMPRMDGLEATAEVRRLEAGGTRRTPILAMTAYAMEEDRRRCLAAGMDGYISKPVKKQDLYLALMQWPASGRGHTQGDDPPKPPPAETGFRPVGLREICGHDEQYARTVATSFLVAAPRAFALMDDALNEGNGARLVTEAHVLTSLCATIGADGLASTLRDLGAIGKQGDNARALDSLARARGQWTRLHAELDQFLTTLGAPGRARAPRPPHRDQPSYRETSYGAIE